MKISSEYDFKTLGTNFGSLRQDCSSPKIKEIESQTCGRNNKSRMEANIIKFSDIKLLKRSSISLDLKY